MISNYVLYQFWASCFSCSQYMVIYLSIIFSSIFELMPGGVTAAGSIGMVGIFYFYMVVLISPPCQYVFLAWMAVSYMVLFYSLVLFSPSIIPSM